ncbi:MAG: hypothetical protein LBH56_03290 [Coriobacteriales bacterium]|nr:hypothetical protein [Coriobacteriales bacterium]
MSRNRKSRSAVGIGLSTLVTIMVAVLLTTFSVLALVSARADLRLSNKVVASTQAYYVADAEAEQWLASLDARVSDYRATSGSGLAGSLAAAGYRVDTAGDGSLRIASSFSIDEGRNLEVELALDTKGEITILRWQTVAGPRER